MARINLDDNVEAQDEFWALLEKCDGDRARALGRLVLFFRVAQKAYGRGEAVPLEEVQAKFADMLASGWAVQVDGGYQALGAAKHFAWYRQKVDSAVAGGRSRAVAPRDGKGRLLPDSSRTPAGNLPTSSPLSPAPALSPAPVKNQTPQSPGVGGLAECIGELQATYDHFRIARQAKCDEVDLARGIRMHSFEKLRLAIIGARYEPKTERFDPARGFNLARLLNPAKREIFDKCVSLGAQDPGAATGAPAERAPDPGVLKMREELARLKGAPL